MKLPDIPTWGAYRPSTKELARGHWASIYAGTLPEIKQTHLKHQPCPACGGKDRFRLFSDWQETGSAICNQCGNGDGFDWLMRITGQGFAQVCDLVEAVMGVNRSATKVDRAEMERRKLAREESARQQQRRDAEIHLHTMHCIMAEVVSLELFKPGLDYLRHRGLGGLIERGDLPMNWLGHPSLTCDGQVFPALVAPIVIGNQMVSLHRTFLTRDGHKAPVESPKKMLPAIWPGATSGAAIRLYRPTTELVVTEGIETALAIRLACPDLPVWACVSANGMKAVLIPEEIERVFIAADNDASGTGQAAAQALQERLEDEGVESSILLPPAPPEGCKGVDWLDVVRGVIA